MSAIAVATNRLDSFRELIVALEAAGNKVIVAQGAALLDRMARRSRPDVMIVDLDHPDLDGPGPIVLLRERFPDTAMIAVGSFYSRKIDLRLRSEGVVHFAIKPLDCRTIIEIVLHCAGRKSRRDAQPDVFNV